MCRVMKIFCWVGASVDLTPQTSVVGFPMTVSVKKTALTLEMLAKAATATETLGRGKVRN